MNVTRVLVATDFSPSADEGLRMASEWASAFGAALTVCHVVPDIAVSAPLFPQVQARVAEELPRLLRGAEAALKRRAQEVTRRPEGSFSVTLAEGSAHLGILEEAQRIGADLIVLSSAGHSAAGQWLLGSVAEQVVRGAQCPVLVARPSPKSGRILAAVDLSDGSQRVVDAALSAAQRLGSEVTLLHALYLEDLFATRLGILAGGPAPSPRPQERQQLHKLVAERLANFTQGAQVRTRTQVVEGSAAAEIDRAAQQLEAGLVVVGTMGLTGASRLLLGSVAAKVVRGAPCSVLVVRGP